ncbi:MAG: hypothetical protein ACJ74U_16205 [Jatrophihabitantaceae bacterium]
MFSPPNQEDMLQRLPADFVARLDITAAVVSETETWRNLLPPEPWVEVVKRDISGLTEYVAARLEAGAYNAVGITANARKGLRGTRPIAIVGIGERIAYRALCDYVLQGQPSAARERDDYRKFAKGPIDAAYAGMKRQVGLRLGDSKFSHLVEADIAAFYQYVDHGVLQKELEMQTGKIGGVQYLVELLGELQGASYGLPQLLDASDALSEVYIRIMERDIVRRGLQVWRYNDDFRVGTTSYSDSEDVIEQLADAAHSIGLVLNEYKTHTIRFISYMLRHVSPEVAKSDEPFDPEDVQVEPEYELDDDESAAEAEGTLKRLDLPPGDEDRIDLKALSVDDLRQIRGAVNTLRRLKRPEALPRVVHLFIFAPSLTPRLCEYLADLYAMNMTEVERIWDALSKEHGEKLSEWQVLWLIDIARRLKLLGHKDERVEFVEQQQLRGAHSVLHAESMLALAEVGHSNFKELDAALRTEPEALAPWYVLGIRALADAGHVTQDRFAAVRDSSPLYKLLLES